MRILSVVALLFLFFFEIDAQEITIIDSNSGLPIEGVIIKSEKKAVQTDTEGKSKIDIFGDKDILSIIHPSYNPIRTDKKRISANGYIIKLTEDPISLKEIVISVSRRPETRAEIPNKLILIDSGLVSLYQPPTTADLVGSKSEVFIQKSQQGGGSPMIRGFSANRLLIVVDGIRMNNAIFRSGNLQNIVSIDPQMIEAAGILVGPGSVVYGSDALGGVININTLKPKLNTSDALLFSQNFSAGFNSSNLARTLHGNFRWGKQNLGFLVAATYSGFSDLVMGRNGPDEYLRPQYVDPGYFNGRDSVFNNNNLRKQIQSGYSQLNLMSKFRYRPSQAFDMSIGVHYSTTSDIPRYDRLIVYRNNRLRYGQWYYGPQNWLMINILADLEVKSAIFDRISFAVGYHYFEESRHDRNIDSPILFHRKENVDVLSLNIDFFKNLNSKYNLAYGFELSNNTVGSSGLSENLLTSSLNEIGSRYPDGSFYRSGAAYIFLKTGFGRRLILNTGGRLTHTTLNGRIDTRFYDLPFTGFRSGNSALNGNVGIIWNLSDSWRASIIASSGFRSPNIDDMAKIFDSEPGNVIVPNPNLKPEYAYNIEANTSGSFLNGNKLEVSLFRTWLVNAMVRRPYTFNGLDSILYNDVLSRVEALVNTDKADIYGFSFTYDISLLLNFNYISTVTIIRGLDSDGMSLRHVPPIFGNSGLVFRQGRLFSELRVMYNGSIPYSRLAPDERNKPYLYLSDKDGNPYSPSWWTLNFASVITISPKLNMSIGMENILDKRYRPYSSGIAAGGRSLLLSLRLSL